MDEVVLAAVGLAAIGDPEFKTRLVDQPAAVAESLGVVRAEVEKLAQVGVDNLEALVGSLIVHRLLPFAIGERLMIVPSSFTQPIDPDRMPIRLDQGKEGAWIDASGTSRIAGRVFGSGAHPTTALSLTALESNLQAGDRVLDLGTGSGVLAIAAVALGAASVDACDVDPFSVEVAQQNAIANGCQDQINLSQDDHASLARRDDPTPYDLIVSNILGPVHLENLDAGLADLLRPGGVLIISGFGENYVDELSHAFESHGLALEAVDRSDPWVAMIGRRT
jgi:ribosomal protein L11 methyltransferase